MKQLLITIAALVLVGCGDNGNQNSSEHNEDHLKVLVKGESIYKDLKLDVSSKHIHSDMYLKFKLYPYLIKPIVEVNKYGFQKAKVLLSFRDKDDFEITKHELRFEDMIFNEDDSGKFLELDHKEYFNLGKYNRIKSATVTTIGWPPSKEGLNVAPDDYSDLIPKP